MKSCSTQFRMLVQIAMLCGMLFMMGCGDGKPERVKVSGQVLFDGKPFTFGYVRFIPSKARQSIGEIDKTGHFKLGCFGPDDGVVLGTHKIEVVVFEQVDDVTTRWHAPKKYANFNSSGLVQEIKGPSDSVVLNLVKDNLKYPYIEKIN